MTLLGVSAAALAIGNEWVHGTLSIDVRNITCRGATPLLCETKSWVMRSRSVNAMELSTSSRVLVPWPRLKCCNSHDYCNANDDDDVEENASTWTHERKIQMDQTYSTVNRETLTDYLTSTNRHTMLTLQPDRNFKEDSIESTNQLLQNRIKALHIAALVLAVAVLISVLASCYVITRFVYFSHIYIICTYKLILHLYS